MANDISKKEFLKRYLETEVEGERKRKKKPKLTKPKANIPCLKIVDKDIDLKSINFGEHIQEDDGDEAPVVAEIIDERPVEVQIKELYESSRWKKIDNDESSQSGLTALQSSGHNSDSNISHHENVNKENSIVKNSSGRHTSDSDISPPRRQTVNKHNTSRRHDSDSDLSPPRHQSSNKNSHQLKNSSRRYSDSDASPPRHQTSNKDNSHVKNSRHDSDSDLSPPRSSLELSSIKSKNKKLDKTLSGLKAGLQNSKSLQKEVQELKNREKTLLNMVDEEISGKNATTIIRDRKTGMKRDLNQEQEIKNEENKKAKEYQQKYDKWGKGTEQNEDRIEKIQNDLYEMSKPLARYKDDEDLDEQLKSIIHDDDPMSEYMKKKKRQKNISDYPVYSGPPAPPNRFGIKPGYRWDGVDRSNGFEKKYFDKINTTKAVQDEAYLWSIQDM